MSIKLKRENHIVETEVQSILCQITCYTSDYRPKSETSQDNLKASKEPHLDLRPSTTLFRPIKTRKGRG